MMRVGRSRYGIMPLPAKFRSCHAAVERCTISALTPEQLDQTIGPPHDAQLRYLLVHGLHDEANYQGEIFLLRKMVLKRGIA